MVGILYLMRANPPGQRTRRGHLYEGALITANAVSGSLAGGIAAHAGLALGLRDRGGSCPLAGWLAAWWQVLPAVRMTLQDRSRLPAARTTPAPVPFPAPLVLAAMYGVVFGLACSWAGALTTLAGLYGGQVLGLGAAVIGRTLAIGYLIEAALLVPVG